MQQTLTMHTPDLADENFRRLAALFPNAVTETTNEAGEVVRAIDADVLRQEISVAVVEGPQERYQFTWPDKKKAIVLANQPIAKTLRLDRARSVGRDGTPGSIDTENLYIEGDNLDALKLLRETYLGKVKMIYIDPPYNTGADFIYKDDFAQGCDEYLAGSGQFDEEGDRLVQNTESNGRFHTDWLNMLYPRLRLAKDLLADDGVIFISIDDHEQENLKKICDEVFGGENFICNFVWKSKSGGANDVSTVACDSEYILLYAKNANGLEFNLDKGAAVTTSYNRVDENGKRYSLDRLDKQSLGYQASLDFPIVGPDGKTYTVQHKNPSVKVARWRWSESTVAERYDELVFKYPYVYTKNYEKEGAIVRNLLIDDRFGRTRTGKTEVATLFDKVAYFSFPKPTKLISYLLGIAASSNCIVLDFFSGSATTAHAVMQLNAEDGGKRQFILVQLPEETGEKSEARKAGYKTICDIGEERIRRAAKKILEETGADIDYGFRVLRVDSTNMEDVYYRPQDYEQQALPQMADNVKPDRTAEDLLIQVMLELGVPLSSTIAEEEIAGKRVFSVADGYLLACFDAEVTDEVVTAIARRRPFYAVLRDSGLASDSVAVNFEQIFQAHSPQTRRKVL